MKFCVSQRYRRTSTGTTFTTAMTTTDTLSRRRQLSLRLSLRRRISGAFTWRSRRRRLATLLLRQGRCSTSIKPGKTAKTPAIIVTKTATLTTAKIAAQRKNLMMIIMKTTNTFRLLIHTFNFYLHKYKQGWQINFLICFNQFLNDYIELVTSDAEV